jgi:hypothetical protein
LEEYWDYLFSQERFMKNLPLCPLILVVCLVAGCGMFDSSSQRSADLQENYLKRDSSPRAAKAVGMLAGEAGAETAPSPPATTQRRMIIKTADLALEIESYDPWMTLVKERVEHFDGFIVSSSSRQAYENARKGELTLRVPQPRFEELLGVLKASAVKVNGEKVSGRDVSEEFFDLEARLANQKRTEKRFQEILKSAATVEDILAVERELSRVREQIERMEGRRRFLQDRVNLSTVNIDWHEPYPLGGGNQGQTLWGKIAEGFKRGIEGFADVLQGLITFVISALPVAAFLALLIWSLKRLRCWWRSRTTA